MNFLMKLIGFVTAFSLAQISQAQETDVSTKWSHESEASSVTVSGNTETESYSLKHKSMLKSSANIYSVGGRFINTRSNSSETARAWDATGRYERELNNKWSAFYQHGAESDVYAGYVQRDNDDLGGKYFFVKEDTEKFFSELGYRQIRELKYPNKEVVNSPSARLYVEYDKKFSETISGKVWIEYLPNLKDSNSWLLNYEPSMSAMLSQVFSLKVSYLVKHHEKVASATEKKDDSTFTTSLVAKF